MNKESSEQVVKASRRGGTETEVVQVSRVSKKKKNLDEVVMTSSKIRTGSANPAFMRGRRSCLDEDDLMCISFVGRSPFV